MNVDEAMRRFADRGEFPRDALQWALDNWDHAAPRFIAKLRAYAAGASGSDVNLDVLFYIIHLCGEKCDSRAYVPLCDVIANDETIDVWFGEAATGNLTRILINLCDGDAEPLKRALEAPEADEYARAAAMQALAYVVRAKGVLDDAEMRAYLSRLASEMQPRAQNSVWQAWAFAIAQLGYEPLRGEVARVFSKRWIDPLEASLDEFYEDLQLARKDADGMAAFSASGVEPFASAIESLENWSYGDDDESEDEDDVELAEDDLDIDADAPLAEDLPVQDGTPYLNPFRDVGRNDPCPCGSGKKYKKCCLAA
jgi:uncharacterized protein